MIRLRQKGSQAIEFALVLPFLILVIFAVLDFGFIVYNKAIITNASREAARQAIILSASAWSADDVRQVACDYARGALITAGNASSSADCSGDRDPTITVTPAAAPAFNTPVTVTVSYEMRGFSMGNWFNLGNGPNSIGSPFQMTATTVMNHE